MFRNPLTDALVVLVILLLFFGPKRLPMLSRSIGESIKEFKGGVTHSSDEEKSQLEAGQQHGAPEPGQSESQPVREPTQASADRTD